EEIKSVIKRKERVLITTLTKRTSEDLCEYLLGCGLKVRYLHSDIDSLERINILRELRLGNFDVLVGVNLLREGLDLPEVSLVAILDADKEGFLRSQTSLIQICGRAARNINGRVILYADTETGSIKRALDEMKRRRVLQVKYNTKNKITPRTIVKEVRILSEFETHAKKEGLALMGRAQGTPEKKNIREIISDLTKQMTNAADVLDFELAAHLRDQIFELKGMMPKRPKSVK
ncbi:helicase-related protein, partial [Elusimicrobiota bacterium]